MFHSEKDRQEFAFLCEKLEGQFVHEKGIPEVYHHSLFCGFSRAEEQYPSLKKALEALDDEHYFEKLLGKTRVAREHPTNIRWAIEAIYVFRFGENPTEDDRIPLAELRREVGEEFFLENETPWL